MSLAIGPDADCGRAVNQPKKRAMISRSLIVVTVICASGCSAPERGPAKNALKPTYDAATGRLKELAYDANGNGRPDTWTEMDGTRPLRSRVDRDEDGKVERWEYYDDKNRLTKVGFSRQADGIADAWAFSGADGKVQRVETSSSRDERVIDRIEYYDSARASGDGPGALVRAEVDANADGRIDQWETYADGALRSVAYDETGDGIADRRLTYERSALTLIESQPDPSGRFLKSLTVKQ